MPTRRVVVAVAVVAVVVGALSALVFGGLLSSGTGRAEETTKALEAPVTRPTPEVARRASEPIETTPVEDTSLEAPQRAVEAEVEAEQSQASGGSQAARPAPQQTEETQAETATAAPQPGESSSVALYTEVEAPSSKQSESVAPDGRDLEIITVLPKDGIRAVFEPEFVTASEYLALTPQEELVLGLSVNGEHRAYPIAYLSRREIVNDVVGGVSIAATW
jgi:FtsZ-interacting cell division protein ZipA